VINAVKLGLHLLEVEITSKCNLNCGHCYNRDIKPQDMPVLQVINLLEFANSNGVSRFVFSGGEAVMHSGFSEIATFLLKSKLALKTVLQSNGSIGKKDISIIKAFDIIHLSFEPDNSTIRKSSTKYILNLARHFIDNGIYTYLFTTIHPGNVNEIDFLVDIANKHGIDLGFNICLPGKKKNLQFTLEEKRLITEKLFELYQQKRILRFTSPFVAILKNQREEKFVKIKGGCTAGVAACVVLTNGDVIPCPFFRIKAGNIYEDKIEKVWLESDIFAAIRNRASFKKPCNTCKFLAHCGGCRARAFSETKELNGFDPECLC